MNAAAQAANGAIDWPMRAIQRSPASGSIFGASGSLHDTAAAPTKKQTSTIPIDPITHTIKGASTIHPPSVFSNCQQRRGGLILLEAPYKPLISWRRKKL
ncbi:hypothetical protein [Aquabacterium sp.]|uniref:hypothetical protein n=1 Tax=Aquabacterium sp. TaxID=1872578 RepID=UPI003BB036A0